MWSAKLLSQVELTASSFACGVMSSLSSVWEPRLSHGKGELEFQLLDGWDFFSSFSDALGERYVADPGPPQDATECVW